MGSTDITNNQIFELLQRTSLDISVIKQEVASFKGEIDSLKSTIEELKIENNSLNLQIVQHEDLLRRKNVLVFGVQETDTRPLEDILMDLFNNKLQVKLKSWDLDNYYRIGEKRTTGNRPILVKFLREIAVKEIFKSVYKLKGTGLSIAKDLSRQKREDNKILYDFLKIAKGKDFPAKIVKSKLRIGEDEYTPDILRSANKNTFLEPFVDKQLLFPNTSAPPTPRITEDSLNGEDGVFVEEEVVKIQNKEQKNLKVTKPEIKSKVGNRNQQVSSQTPKTARTRSTSNQQVSGKNSKTNK